VGGGRLVCRDDNFSKGARWVGAGWAYGSSAKVTLARERRPAVVKSENFILYDCLGSC
jgi:hypothetical protein